MAWAALRPPGSCSDRHRLAEMRCRAFEVPPVSAWPNIVAALRYVGTYVTPRIGPVEVVSVYRIPGSTPAPVALHSALTSTSARSTWSLEADHSGSADDAALPDHQASGERFWVGLGLYIGIRFHIDSKKYREWACRARVVYARPFWPRVLCPSRWRRPPSPLHRGKMCRHSQPRLFILPTIRSLQDLDPCVARLTHHMVTKLLRGDHGS